MRNRFDTLKFAIPAEAVQGIRQAAFNEKTDCDLETGQVRTWLKAKPSALPIGFAELTNERNHPDWTISLSAKTLGDSYLQGIGLENIEEALSGIGQILDLNLYKALDSNPPSISGRYIEQHSPDRHWHPKPKPNHGGLEHGQAKPQIQDPSIQSGKEYRHHLQRESGGKELHQGL
jgi:hypothetical protein